MEKFQLHYGGEITAEQLLSDARRSLGELENYYSERGGWQNHRHAVIGKNLYVCAHGIDKLYGGFGVSIRVDTQYTDHAYAIVSTRNDCKKLACEIENLLSIDPAGIKQ